MKKILLSAFLVWIAVSASAADALKDSLDFDRMNASSPAEMFRGKVSGVRVSSSDGGINESLNTAIRAAGVLRSGNEPLWIVDGAVLSESIDRNLDAFWQSSYSQMHYTSAKNKLSFLNPYDIESIEIVKNASAAALYGSMGANGVIVIKTKSAERNGTEVNWSSNFGLNTDASNAGMKPAFLHNHTVSVAGRGGGNSYRISAYFRKKEGTIQRDKNLGGGINVNFDAKANKVIWFGLKSIISIGDANSQSGTAWYGHESATQLLRKTGSVDSYILDYDDDSRNYRTVNTAYLRVNFLRDLHWVTDLGIDYQHDTRYVWYGASTQFGALRNGAAAILTSSMLQYRASTKLDYELFAGKHHFSALVGAEAYGMKDKLNTMNGADFFNHELRARGLRFNGEKPVLRELDDNMSHLGLMANAKYDYNGIAGLDIAFRADNSARYDDGKFSLYPAADVWLDIHKFFPESNAVSTLKLNGGYGKTGKDTFAPYELFSQLCPGLVISNFQTGTESLYDGIARIRAEEWHVEGNFGFISDRITLGLTWYERSVTDSFSWYCFGFDSGKNNRWKPGDRVDLGSEDRFLKGKGLEVDLAGQIIRKGNVNWTADVNLTWQQTERAQFSNVDLQLFPVLFGGLSTRLSAGRWTVDLAADASYGNEILNMNRMLNEQATTPDRKYVERADFIRIGKAGVTYDIPVNVKWLKGLRVYAECLNLATFSPYTGFNPDVDSYSKIPYLSGADYSSFPLMRTFMVGVNLKF